MKPITIHPGSALAGAALATVSLLASSAVQTTTHSAIAAPGCWRDPIQVVGIPDPRDMVQIREGQPYAVPPEKLFVLTGLGETGNGSSPILLTVDGQKELTVVEVFAQEPPTVAHVPTGFTVQAGSTVEVFTGNPLILEGRAWGYLVDE